MGSGHTGRGGRGGANRRARRGMQRPGGPQTQTQTQTQTQAQGQGQAGLGRPAPATSTVSPSLVPPPAPAPPPAAHAPEPAAEAHAPELPPTRDAAGKAGQQRLVGSEAAGEQGTERAGHAGPAGHAGHPGHGGHTDRRGPQLVPSTSTGPLPRAERRFEGRPPTDYRTPPQQTGHASEPHPGDAGSPSLDNSNWGPAMGGRSLPERNGHFIVSERTPRFDNEGDEAESDLRELPQRDVRGDVGPLIDSLRTVFERDRGVASQGGNARCGICYLHYPLGELEYRSEEGYYVCPSCAQRLGSTRLPMVRRQQR